MAKKAKDTKKDKKTTPKGRGKGKSKVTKAKVEEPIEKIEEVVEPVEEVVETPTEEPIEKIEEIEEPKPLMEGTANVATDPEEDTSNSDKPIEDSVVITPSEAEAPNIPNEEIETPQLAEPAEPVIAGDKDEEARGNYTASLKSFSSSAILAELWVGTSLRTKAYRNVSSIIDDMIKLNRGSGKLVVENVRIRNKFVKLLNSSAYNNIDKDIVKETCDKIVVK